MSMKTSGIGASLYKSRSGVIRVWARSAYWDRRPNDYFKPEFLLKNTTKVCLFLIRITKCLLFCRLLFLRFV